MSSSNDMSDAYSNVDKYNPGKKHKILVVFDHTILQMITNKKLEPRVNESFIYGRKLNISLFSLHCHIKSTHYFIMKIPNKREVQQIAFITHLKLDLIIF